MMSPAWWRSKAFTGSRISLLKMSRRIFWAARREMRIMQMLTKKDSRLLPA